MTSYRMQDITGDSTSPSGARYLETLKRNADHQPAPYKPGLGTWRVGIRTWDEQRKPPSWVYIAPSGIEYSTFFYLARYSEPPPPLPQPGSARRACSCGSAYVCSECRLPYFIEIHGVADWYGTYCYYTGLQGGPIDPTVD